MHTKPMLRAARRLDAERRIDLSRRRRWFDTEAEGGKGQSAQGDGQQEQDDSGQQPLPPDLQALIDEIRRDPVGIARHVKELRAESATQRVKAREAEAQRQAAEEARLANERKFEELAETRKRQLDEAKPKLERLEALEAHLQKSVQARIEALPQRYRSMVPKFDDPLKTLDWLDANASLLVQQRAPDLDSGKSGERGGASADASKLTADQREMAQRLGISPEEYARYAGTMTAT